MYINIDGKDYEIVIEKKRSNKNTYIRVNKELQIKVTTGIFTTKSFIINLINENMSSIKKMISNQVKKRENNTGFFYLGKKYDIVYTDNVKGLEIYNDVVYMNEGYDIDKWYKKQAKKIFLEHLNNRYNMYTKKIPYPKLKIRKMTTRWGVCNIKTYDITLNLELIKRDTKYLDYVIVHELTHLRYGNHSKYFWNLVEENMPEYKKYRDEMKVF